MSLRYRFYLEIEYLKSKIIKINAQTTLMSFEDLFLKKKFNLKERLKCVKKKNRRF